MLSTALFGITVVMGLVAWGAVAYHYIWPALKERSSEDALKPILLLHAFRFLGLAMLIPGVASANLPAAFAQPTAYGDFTAAILALLALATLGSRTGTLLIWIFNIFGTADLFFAFFNGARTSLPETQGLLGAAWFLLSAYVPLLLVTHGLAFKILLRSKVAAPSRSKLTPAQGMSMS